MLKCTKGTRLARLAVMIAATAVLAGCLDESRDSTGKNSSTQAPPSSGSGTGSSGSGTAHTSNKAPTISGTAPTKVTIGQTYDFTPRASDPDGDPLTFSAAGVPSWLTFDPSSGRLFGKPTEADVASYGTIRISVSDGRASAALKIAGIAVVQSSAGSATLSWEAPTMNADGTPLTDLSGYKIRYGTSPGSLNQVIDVNNPGITTYVVENLGPATWYFSVSSVNSQGLESQPTGVVWTKIG